MDGEFHRLKYALSSGNISFIASWLSRYGNLLIDDNLFLSIDQGTPDFHSRKYGLASCEFWLSVSSSVLASIGKSIKTFQESNQSTCADSEEEEILQATDVEQSKSDPASINVCLEILARILLLCSKSMHHRSKILRRDVVDLIRGSEIQSALIAFSAQADPPATALILALLSASMDYNAHRKYFQHDVVLKAAGIFAIIIAGIVRNDLSSSSLTD